jgi:hypothetical protein
MKLLFYDPARSMIIDIWNTALSDMHVQHYGLTDVLIGTLVVPNSKKITDSYSITPSYNKFTNKRNVDLLHTIHILE